MRISINQRIGIGLAILIVLQVIVLIVMRIEVGRFRDSTHTLNSYIIPATNTLSELESQQLGSFSDTLQYLVTGVPSHLEESVAEDAAVRVLLTKLTELQTAAPDTVAERLKTIATLEQSIQAANVRIRASVERYQRGEQIDLAAFAHDIDISENEVLALVDVFNSFLIKDREQVLATTNLDPLLIPGIIGALALCIAFGISFYNVRPVVERLNRLGAAALHIALGQREKEVAVEGNDEIADLARALNTMLGQVAEQQQALGERAVILEGAIETQRQLLTTVQSLAVPTIPVGAHTLALPLIGYLDQARMQQISDQLLDAIYREKASIVLIDVTGLVLVDQAAARFLLEITSSVGLLGTRAALTGINSSLAQTLVALDVDLGHIRVYPTLREGIAASLAKQR